MLAHLGLRGCGLLRLLRIEGARGLPMLGPELLVLCTRTGDALGSAQ